jgi:PAS domain S-box-containing protein
MTPRRKAASASKKARQGKGAKSKKALVPESSFQRLAEILPIAIFAFQKTKNCFVNSAAAALTGYSRQELLAMNFWEVIHPDMRPIVKNRGLDRLRGSEVPPSYEVKILRKSGEERWVVFSGDIIRFQGKRTVIGIVIDITERKQAEEAARRQQEQVRALHEINLASTSSLDVETLLDRLLEKVDLLLPYSAATIRLFNKETRRLDHVACRNIDEAAWKTRTSAARHQLGRAILETKTPLSVANMRMQPRTTHRQMLSREGLVSFLGVPLIAKDAPLGVLSIYTKTEHAFSTDEIEFLSTLASQASAAIHNAQLYERARSQAVELEKANKVKSEFLGLMSHELRTPLNAILGYAAALRDQMFGEINPKQEEALSKVESQSYDLLAMINSVLEATKIESEALSVDNHELDLVEFLNDLRSSYDFPLPKNLELVWDYPAELPVVKSDRVKVKHILQNLINNAIKFTEKGRIVITARLTGRALVLKVRDSGIGIPPDNIAEIFGMFRQVDSSDTRAYGGVGLGLYLVKKFVDLLGGAVEVKSVPGRGSEFTVTLPCAS